VVKVALKEGPNVLSGGLVKVKSPLVASLQVGEVSINGQLYPFAGRDRAALDALDVGVYLVSHFFLLPKRKSRTGS
jgi:hypothetical protein